MGVEFPTVSSKKGPVKKGGKPASRGRQENTGNETHTRDQNRNEVGFREMLHSADESRESEGERCVQESYEGRP